MSQEYISVSLRLKPISKKFLSIIIVFSVWAAVLFMTYNIVNGWLIPNTTKGDTVSIDNCVPIKTIASSKQVVIRLDDIQAMAYRDMTKQLIETSMSQGVPLVLGVIPENIGTDTVTTGLIRNNLCNLEVALHGWDNQKVQVGDKQVSEFETISETEANRRLDLGIQEIESTFGVQPVTFIPPDGAMSTAAVTAVVNKNLKNISQSSSGYFDLTTATYDFETDDQLSLQKINSDCEAKFTNANLCVIVVHPQDFVTNGITDNTKFQEYLDLLNYITVNKWQPVLFKNQTLIYFK